MGDVRQVVEIDYRKIFLDDPVLMLSKLASEIAEIHQRPKGALPERIFLSLNAASTAWHLHQWIWELCGVDRREQLASAFGLDKKNAKGFGSACCQRSASIRICRQMSIAAKHVRVDHDRRDDIYPKVYVDRDKEGDRFTVKLCHEGVEHDDTDVFIAALRWWNEVYIQLDFKNSPEVQTLLSQL